MKSSYTCMLLVVLLLGCKNDSKLTLETFAHYHKACDNCPEVQINIPKAVTQTKLNDAINLAMNEEVVGLLHFEDDIQITTLDSALNSFTEEFKRLESLYDDETTPWEADINAEVAYEDKRVLTIELDAYIFTGGAHGYNSIRLINFDKKKGIKLENWQLLKDSLGFQNFAEKKFRNTKKIPLDKAINHTGFMFDNNSFYLPENIGFSSKGIKLLYNQYEVSSYAEGPIELTLPYKEINSYLNQKIKSKR